MKQIDIGIIGTGWCGGIRAETCATHPLVKRLHLAETHPQRLAEIANATGAQTASADYHDILRNDRIDAVIISATPSGARSTSALIVCVTRRSASIAIKAATPIAAAASPQR